MPLLSTLPLRSPKHPSVTHAIVLYALQLITRGHLLPAPTPSQQNERQQTREMTKQCTNVNTNAVETACLENLG
ncbi:hypothetical protein L207DRAFT_507829 [Hyaloscypha variabilis F]|uniref:Uncharacterized protein n=1 Tax=Hyaloscypha variabilis (strain UAMH 11265 / GT02V1 / F) TaxID=1149755 RepID=A0A2J6S2B0_HYAVF|nr:hypothetical protein L207DRAFT_507829 [Hyaloscypha variabilis F]